MTTAYDALNRPTVIKENGTASLVSYAYDDLGRRTTVTLGNGTSTTYGYDANASLGSLAHNLADTAQDQTYTYTRNQAREIATHSWSNDLYQWAGVPGNATNGTRSYSANGLNQYTAAAGATISHDANGNLTGDGTWSYGYDENNRLKTASKAGTSATLAYDAEGRLRQSVVNAATANLLYDGVALVAEYDAGGSLQNRWVHGPGVDEPIVVYAGATTANKSWLYKDHLGSIVGTADGTGTSTAVYSYGPYGEPNTTAGQRFRYTGQQLIGELGLDYYKDKARFYSPTLGRFLQTDPIGTADDLNLYAYVGNNPVNFNDPSGMAAAQAKILGGNLLKIAGEASDLWTGGYGALMSQSVAAGDYAGALANLGMGAAFGVMNVYSGGSGAALGRPGSIAVRETTSLFRAVGPGELADITTTNALRNLGSAEGKYFTTSAAEASAYAKQAVKTFGDQPYTIIRTDVPKSIFKGLSPATVDGGIPAWVIPTDRLPGLVPSVLDHSPLPPLKFSR